MAHMYFGKANASYPKGFPQNWSAYTSLRRRPDEDGADVIVFGLKPNNWSTQAVLLTDTLADAHRAVQQWRDSIGAVRDLVLSDPGPATFAGTVLRAVTITYGPRRAHNATTGNWITGVNLVFSRTAETSP